MARMGFCTEPAWDPDRLAVADSGAIHAICHVRGGGEMGYAWHEGGRRASKPNSFSDLVACARCLRQSGLAKASAIAVEGRSAGGLLVGAAINLAPDAFGVAVAGVPFVDVMGARRALSSPSPRP